GGHVDPLADPREKLRRDELPEGIVAPRLFVLHILTRCARGETEEDRYHWRDAALCDEIVEDRGQADLVDVARAKDQQRVRSCRAAVLRRLVDEDVALVAKDLALQLL